MRATLFCVSLFGVLCLVSAFSLDELLLSASNHDELLLPRRERRGAAEESTEVLPIVGGGVGSGQEAAEKAVLEGSGERIARDAELVVASGEEPIKTTAADEEKIRTRREDSLLVASGEEAPPVIAESSGEEPLAPAKPIIRLRRAAAEAEEDEVKASGQELEGSGQEA